MSNFRKFLSDIKNSHAFKVEKVKLEFVRSLNRLMTLNNIKPSDLAAKLDTSSAYISKALRGDTNFTIDSMVKLSNAVGGKVHIHISNSAASVRWLEVHSNTIKNVGKLETESVEEFVVAPSERETIDVKKIFNDLSSEPNNEKCRVFA